MDTSACFSVLLMVTLSLLSFVQGENNVVVKEVLMFGETYITDVSNVNDGNVATSIPLQSGHTAPWFSQYELKPMTSDNQNIIVKWSLSCTHQYVYAMVDLAQANYDGTRYRKCSATGTPSTEGSANVCEFDCGAGYQGKTPYLRISHVDAGQELYEVKYDP